MTTQTTATAREDLIADGHDTARVDAAIDNLVTQGIEADESDAAGDYALTDVEVQVLRDELATPVEL